MANPAVKWCAGFSLLVLTAATLSVGWLQPDEHARVLEPAHQIVYGYAALPWEFQDKLVSMLLGVVHAPVLYLAKSLGLSGLGEAAALRAFTGLVAATRLLAFAGILDFLGLRRERRGLYTALYGLGIFGLLHFVRTSQENWATTALVWGVWCVLRALTPEGRAWLAERRAPRPESGVGLTPDGKRFIFAAAALLAFATTCRLQMGFTALALWGLAVFCGGRAAWLPAVLGGLVGLLPGAIVDGIYGDFPFQPAWNYLIFALGGEGGGKIWGTSPWYFYFGEYFTTWLPPLGPVLAVPLLVGIWRSPLAALYILPTFIVQSSLGHKEVRYLSPLVPMLYLASYLGFEVLERERRALIERWVKAPRAQRWWRGALAVYFAIGILGAGITLNSSPLMFSELDTLAAKGVLRPGFIYAGATMSPPSYFYFRHPTLPYEPMDRDRFLAQLAAGGGDVKGRQVALYGFREGHFKVVEERCQIIYQSVPPWQVAFFHRFPRINRIRAVHAIAQC